MKYQFFGDTHGEIHWKNLIDSSCIQVFLGDYFSPYRGQTFEQCKENFLDIIHYKEEHPETILLIGNHDEDHWHIKEGYSRQDKIHLKEISSLFEQYKNYFQIALHIDKYLITHSGVTKEWKNKYLPNINETPAELAPAINNLWITGKYDAFRFDTNASYFDSYGETERHGPLWIRWDPLKEHNIFKDTVFKQIVGHTLDTDFRYFPDKNNWSLCCIDCMAYQGKSLILDI